MEVLKHHVTLELRDPDGHEALYKKQQTVRFLQDNIIAYQDMAWGDGDIFASYACSPGFEVDRYREGHRHHVLISLRETKNRGDIEHFRIERTIRNGFVNAQEDLQTEIDYRMRDLTMSVLFPPERPPRRAMVIEQNTNRTNELKSDHVLTLPDGRHQITWENKKPRLFEAYILRWTW